MLCQRCGTTIEGNALFCASCGQDLGATTPMAAITERTDLTDLEIIREALKADYDVREELGRGGMAMVFRARERELKRDVAIKVLPFSHSHDAKLVERFAQEARTAAKLEHPNVISIYRVGRSGDVIYFAMRFLRGPALSELIQHAALDPGDIRRIIAQSASGLGHAHANGVVHRDVKPDNIMFKESGEVVMCDFGIAKAVFGTQLTGTGMAIGTPYYMSPEQVRAHPVDGRSDLYSLGVVAYQCLTRQVPFDGEDSFAIGYKHVTEDIPVPQLRTQDHRELFEIIRKMMAKAPEDRYQDADELIKDLSSGMDPAGMLTGPAAAAVSYPGMASRPPRPSQARTFATQGPPPTTPNTPIPSPPHREAIVVAGKKKRRGGVLVGMFLLLLFGGAGGGGYLYVEGAGGIEPVVERHPALRAVVSKLAALGVPLEINALATDSTETAEPTDSTILATTALGDSTVHADSTVALDSATVADSIAIDSTGATTDSVVAPAVPEVVAPTTGHLIVSNLGRDASMWINDRPVRGLRHDLAPGRYELRIVAPGSKPYKATVTLAVGDTLRHRVRMASALPESQCERLDDSYNRRGECFDQMPRMLVATVIPVGSTVPRFPAQPAILAIQVFANGSPGEVLIKSPSDVPEFTLLAIQFARGLSYQPGTKDGLPVMGWVQVPFYPQQQ
ncbi:MAG: protein kinase [Gemmatimonadetes bacterium]|nr:protein kinase [Gemmatimonadota bacterium]